MVNPVSATRVTGRYMTQQKGLPILPVPTLQQTCERYLTALEPFVEVDELKHIKEQLEEFQKPGGVGERLQRGLERRAHVTGNWNEKEREGGTQSAAVICNETNKESVSAIERSIFVMCLDRLMPKVSDEMYTDNAACQILHGGGSQWNSSNRWFDKSMQLIVAEDGICGGNASHATADGTVLMSFFDHIVNYINRKKQEMPQSFIGPLPIPRKLHFNITPELKRDIEEAKQSMDIDFSHLHHHRLAQDVDLKVLVFDHFGKNVLKAHKISPDAFVQMAIQLAYYRLHQRCPAAVEPVSLRMFKHGRTGTVCATTSASTAFVKAFDDPGKQSMKSIKLSLAPESNKAHRSRDCQSQKSVASNRILVWGLGRKDVGLTRTPAATGDDEPNLAAWALLWEERRT
ncbi:hypothetical protein PAMA_008209 [Pampus argenteus]